MLTPKQEKFVQGIIEGKSQAEAYRSAYNCEKMSDNAIYREASLLMDAPKIAQRLKELREQMMTPSIMSAQERLEYLTRVIKGEEVEETVCWEDGERVTYNSPATIKTRLQAVDLMNKMQGEYVQKVVADVDTSYTINIELSDD
jgi:phage terminase small subunit